MSAAPFDAASLTPEQEQVYADTRAMLIDQGFAPSVAETTARGRAQGFEIPPPSPPPKRRAMVVRMIDREVCDVPRGETGLELLNAEMTPIRYLCDPWAAEGCNLLAGRPKLGKTTLLRQKAAAIASGGKFLGEGCQRTPAVFLSLEEGRRMMWRKLQIGNFTPDELAGVTFFYTWPRGKDGALQIMRYIEAHPGALYWAIDSLTKFREPPDARTSAFVADYEAMTALHNITKSTPGLCIDVLHHTRKAKGDDPIEEVSGTFGLTAACDSYAVMRYNDGGAILHIGGRLWDRDVDKYELRRGAQRWELVGEYTGLPDALSSTLEALRQSGGMTPSDAAKFWTISRQGAYDRLSRLVQAGKATCREGVYYAIT